MSYTNTSKESLEALGKVISLCLPDWPCNRSTCRRCKKRLALEELTTQEQSDIDEDAFWESD